MKRLNQKGFTLVELLIVVAIIGILSTIGIPTYKRMVQKAKKSEAKVAMGGLYTATVAFFSEYGAYGTNLDRIGFDMEGTNRTYGVGFPLNNACAVLPANLPTSAIPVGAAIFAAFPGYYGTISGTDNRNYLAPATAGLGAGANDGCQPSAAVNPMDAFVATASGMIAPGHTHADRWTINNNRALVNIQDGVK